MHMIPSLPGVFEAKPTDQEGEMSVTDTNCLGFG